LPSSFPARWGGKIEWTCGLGRPEVYQDICRLIVKRVVPSSLAVPRNQGISSGWQSQTARYTPQNITHKTQRTHAPCELCVNHLIHSASTTISIHPVHTVDTRCATQRLLATCDYAVTLLSVSVLLITLMCTCDVSDNAKTTSLYLSSNAHFDMHEADDLRFMSNLCTLFRLALIARLACHILAVSELASSSVLSTRSSLPSTVPLWMPTQRLMVDGL
jgi:hypothetical protein